MTAPARALRLDGRVVALTGASGGLGRAIAGLLHAQGAHLVMGFHDDAVSPEQLVAEVGGEGEAVPTDVRDAAQAEALVALAIQRHGRLDALVNNAGVMEQVDFVHLTPAVWAETLAVNLTGAYHCVRAAQPWLGRSPHAAIVNVASQLAYTGARGAAAYVASKAGLLGLTRALAHDLAPGIRVNAVAPGPLETPMTEPYATPEWIRDKTSRLALGRFGQPHEAATAVLFLLSDEASYFTGQTLSPNGGGAMP